MPAILASLASLAVSTVFSRAPRVSVEYLGYALVLAALYLLLVRLFANGFFRPRITALASLLFILTVGAFLVRVGTNWIEWWGLLGRVSIPPLRPGFEGLTYLNPSAVLTMAALLAAPAAASVGSSRRWGGFAVGLIVVAVLGVAVLSGSRAGWLALGLTALVIPPLWISMPNHRALSRAAVLSVLGHRTLRTGFALLALVAIGLAVVFAPAVLLRAGAGGESLRATLATTALRMFSEAPLVGTGPGTWVIQRVAYTQPNEVDYYIPHAHNLEIQTLAELGILGAIAGIVVVGSLIWLFRGAVTDLNATRRRWGWAGLTALLYFAFHQLLDFYVNMPAFLFASALPIAYLDATAPRPMWRRAVSVQGGSWARRAAPIVAMCTVFVALSGLLVQEVPAGELARAVAAAESGDWEGAERPAAEAARMDPDMAPYLFTAGLAASRAGAHVQAAAYFEQVATRDDLPEAWLNLAAEQAELGRGFEAVNSLTSALVLGRQRPAVSMPAGDLALRLGETDLARDAFTAALLSRPSLAADPWWRATIERGRIFDEALRVALSVAVPRTGWELELMVGDYERAEALAISAGLSAASVVTQAWLGDAAANDDLKQYCLRNPLDIETLLWCARVEGRRGDLRQANAFRAMANTASSGAFELGAELRVATSGTGSPMYGTPADFWGTYTYRRPTPTNILVPSLVHLGLE